MSSTRYLPLRGAGAAGRLALVALVMLETTLLRLIRFIIVSENATHASASAIRWGYLQLTADAAGAIIHDAKAKAFHLQFGREASAVIRHGQFEFVALKFERHLDVLRFAVLDGIVDGFLRDSEN